MKNSENGTEAITGKQKQSRNVEEKCVYNDQNIPRNAIRSTGYKKECAGKPLPSNCK